MDKLSSREKYILELVIQGLTNKEIGLKLNLSMHTIKAYLENIYRKLGVTNRMQAAVVAFLDKRTVIVLP